MRRFDARHRFERLPLLVLREEPDMVGKSGRPASMGFSRQDNASRLMHPKMRTQRSRTFSELV